MGDGDSNQRTVIAGSLAPNAEKLMRKVRTVGSLGCSDHALAKFSHANSQHVFTKGEIFLANLVAFYSGFRAFVDEGSVTDVINLELC